MFSWNTCTPSLTIAISRSNQSTEIVEKEWLDPRECVSLVQELQQNHEHIHDLFRAVRINMILRSK